MKSATTNTFSLEKMGELYLKVYRMKIWHIGCTHGMHAQLNVPQGTDIVIHSGDAGNSRDATKSMIELEPFFRWYADLPIKHKIYVPGNHDTAMERWAHARDFPKSLGIQVLVHEEYEIEGLKMFGSPWTPEFNNWSFNKSRNTIGRLWEQIPDELDVLITHGPPKGILDLTENRDGSLEQCGDGALLKAIEKRNIKYNMFSHIHNCTDIINVGTRTVGGTIYSNASAVKDGHFNKGIIHHGNIFEL